MKTLDLQEEQEFISTHTLNVIVPSRNRLDNALRLAEQFDRTCTWDTRIWFVNATDAEIYDENLFPGSVRVIRVGPGAPGVVSPLNKGWDVLRFGGLYSLFTGFMGDDHLPKHRGWDEDVVESLSDAKAKILYGNDLLMGEKLATAVFMTSNIPSMLGYMAPSQLNHLYCDNFWVDLGRKVGILEYRKDLIIEHLHPALEKAKWDATYSRANTDAHIKQDKLAYENLDVDTIARVLRENLDL